MPAGKNRSKRKAEKGTFVIIIEIVKMCSLTVIIRVWWQSIGGLHTRRVFFNYTEIINRLMAQMVEYTILCDGLVEFINNS